MTHRARSVDIIPAEMLLSAYAGGYFPMSEPDSESVQWYYSDPSAIIPLDDWKIPRSLKQFMRSPEAKGWTISTDRDFTSVIRSCSRRRDTWISDTIIRSYINLHGEGHAHSVEVWEDSELAGGLYGVTLGSAFFGESMFHRRSNASKVALAALLHIVTDAGYSLLDIQMMTPVMEQFGSVSVPRTEYLERLGIAVREQRSFPRVEQLTTARLLEFIEK
jgi:leucyl/phenylalanyl-tRNA---protein transferase